MMDIDLVLRLEEKVDLILKRNKELQDECLRLRQENEAFVGERERLKGELDRILAKLDDFGRQAP